MADENRKKQISKAVSNLRARQKDQGLHALQVMISASDLEIINDIKLKVPNIGNQSQAISYSLSLTAKQLNKIKN